MKKLLGTFLIAVLVLVIFPPQVFAAQTVTVVRNTLCSTPGCTTDFTSSGFGTPTAAIIILDNSNTASNPQANTRFSIGFWDGTNQNAVNAAAQDVTDPTLTLRGATTTAAVLLSDDAAIGSSYRASTITDGIRLTMVYDTTTADRFTTVLLFNGISAKTGEFTPNATQNGTATSGSLGFAPKLVFFTTIGTGAAPQNGIATYLIGLGLAESAGSKHRWLNYFSADAAAANDDNIVLSETRAIGQASAGTFQWTAEVTTFGADSFTMTTRDGATGSDVVYYLALGGADLSYEVGSVDSRTTAGTTVVPTTNPTDALLFVQSNNSSTSTIATLLNGSGGFGVGLASGANQYAHNNSGEDGAATPNYNAQSTTTQIIANDIGASGGTSLFLQASVTLNPSDFTLNYTKVDGTARKSFYVAFGDAAASGEPGGVASDPSHVINGGWVINNGQWIVR